MNSETKEEEKGDKSSAIPTNSEAMGDDKSTSNSKNVGLPVSTSDEEEDTSSDEALTAAGDDLCRSLQKEALTPKRKNAQNGDSDSRAPMYDNNNESSLEERVEELETKLATLSRILQQQQNLSVRSLLTRSRSNSQRSLSPQQPRIPELPLTTAEPSTYSGRGGDNNSHHNEDPPDSPPHSQRTSKGLVPYLESPAPFDDCSPRDRQKMHQRQRLSFHLLYEGNEDNLRKGDDEEHTQKPDNNSTTYTMQGGNNDQMVSDSHINQKEQSNGHHNDNNNSEETHPLKKINNSSSHQNSSLSSPKSDNAGRSTVNSTILDTAASVVENEEKQLHYEKDSGTTLENSTNSLDNSQLKKSSHSTATSGQDSSSTSINSSSTAPTTTTTTTGFLQPLLLSKDKRSKWLDHLNSFQESNHDVDVQMQEFIKVPGSVEKTLAFGFLICIDSFLYVSTILPIRFAWSCVLLSLHYFFKWTKKPAGNYQFHRRHTYQLIQVSIILSIYRYVLLPISIGKLYHWIRGQAMIKLYVLIAIVEVFDRLMCSLGQDCLDSMYWNTTRRPHSSRMLISVSVVVVYTAVHSLILLLHVATLNVAMNSADEALLALLIAGNFAEIKSTVFKKYNKSSLFKIVANDICERFKLALFLGLVLLLNFCQGMDSRKMSDYQRIAGIVWMSELLCDWLKHAFITKFNFIPSSVYPEYGLLLAGDVTGIGHEGVNLDHSHAVVKRIGFAQMPLVCIMARLAREAVKYMTLRIDMNTVSLFRVVLGSSLGWLLLLGLKMFLGAYLQRTSLAKLHAAPELSQTPLKQKQQ